MAKARSGSSAFSRDLQNTRRAPIRSGVAHDSWPHQRSEHSDSEIITN